MNKFLILILSTLIFTACNSHKTKKVVSTIHEPGFYSIEFDTSKFEINLKGVKYEKDTLDSLRFFLSIPSPEYLKSNQLTFVGRMSFKDGQSSIKIADIDSVVLFVKDFNELSKKFKSNITFEEKNGVIKLEEKNYKNLICFFPRYFTTFTCWIEVSVTNGLLESVKGKETNLGTYALKNNMPINPLPSDFLKEFSYTHIVNVE